MAQYAAGLALGVAFLFALGMIFQKSLYKSAICLLGVLLQAAVFFYLSGSPLLAFLQVMIYAGAVMVLLVVTIMASPLPSKELWSGLPVSEPLALVVLGALTLEGWMIFNGGAPSVAATAGAALDSRFGSFLFGPYALATEAVGFLMLLAGLAVLTVGEEGRP